MIQFEIDVDEEFLPCYHHLVESDADINFLWGGRDSGKSYFVACRLLLACLTVKKFKCILIRKVYDNIKDSQWELIKQVAEQWGIDHYFVFNQSPLEIRCILNGNKFIARGCDKPGKLKSITNPTHVWYEEGNQLNEEDHITISTTIRNAFGKVQEWFTFNPEAPDDFEDFWLFKNYFKEHYDSGEYTFNGIHTIELPDGRTHQLKYTSTHTTYQDNPFCTIDRIARHESLKRTNPYYYRVFTKGLWGRRMAGGEFYKCYSTATHVGNIKVIPGFENQSRVFAYNPDLALHMAWDFNVNPYVTCNIWQGRDKWVGKIVEILLQHPRNTDLAVCDEFERLFPSHNAGLYIYGDPGGLKQSTADQTTVRVAERDYSEFTQITTRLKKYRPELRVPRAYPNVKLRGQFINTVFESKFNDITIVFDERCKRSDSEYSNLKEASDGTKFKEMYKDDVTQVPCQKYGHISDADDYFITQYFEDDFYLFQNNGEMPGIVVGKNYKKNRW